MSSQQHIISNRPSFEFGIIAWLGMMLFNRTPLYAFDNIKFYSSRAIGDILEENYACFIAWLIFKTKSHTEKKHKMNRFTTSTRSYTVLRALDASLYDEWNFFTEVSFSTSFTLSQFIIWFVKLCIVVILCSIFLAVLSIISLLRSRLTKCEKLCFS